MPFWTTCRVPTLSFLYLGAQRVVGDTNGSPRAPRPPAKTYKRPTRVSSAFGPSETRPRSFFGASSYRAVAPAVGSVGAEHAVAESTDTGAAVAGGAFAGAILVGPVGAAAAVTGAAAPEAASAAFVGTAVAGAAGEFADNVSGTRTEPATGFGPSEKGAGSIDGESKFCSDKIVSIRTVAGAGGGSGHDAALAGSGGWGVYTIL